VNALTCLDEGKPNTIIVSQFFLEDSFRNPAF